MHTYTTITTIATVTTSNTVTIVAAEEPRGDALYHLRVLRARVLPVERLLLRLRRARNLPQLLVRARVGADGGRARALVHRWVIIPI